MRRLFAAVALVLAFGATTSAHAEEPMAVPVTTALPEEDQAVPADRIRTLLQAQMRHCWRMPVDQPQPERLIVTVEFELNRDGTLRGRPRVVSPTNYQFDAPMRVAVRRALRAVRTCAPYSFQDDPVVGSAYDSWSKLELTFRIP